MLGKLPHACMNCNQNTASVKLTKLIKGTVEEFYLCQDCAAKQSPYQKKHPPSLDAILAGILSHNKDEQAERRPPDDLTCPTCGIPFDSYRSTLLLGCSDCYESFEKFLAPDLRKFHGSTIHRGRVPEDAPQIFQKQNNPVDLKKRLVDAVKAEDFQLAAKLRDELKRLEVQTGGVS